MLQVEELKIRVPSMSEEAARGLGEAVANRLVKGIPDELQSGAIGSIHVRLHVEEGMSEAGMVSEISSQILKELKFL